MQVLIHGLEGRHELHCGALHAREVGNQARGEGEREEMRILHEGGEQPFKTSWELDKVCGTSSWLEQVLGKLGLEPQERWMCVCGGGGGEMAPGFPWKLEEELS